MLTQLSLENNGISDVEPLVDLVRNLPSIQVYVVATCFVHKCVCCFLLFCCFCCVYGVVLVRLDLSDNRIGDSGAKDLAETLKVTRLQTLNIANNSMLHRS